MTTTPTAALPLRRPACALLVFIATLASFFVAAKPAESVALTNSQMASSVASTVNSIRRAHGLPSLLVRASLNTTAYNHSYRMARYNLLLSRIGSEATVPTRIYRAGFDSAYALENRGVTRYQYQLLRQPHAMHNDVRAANMLSRKVTYMGVGVYRDRTHNKYWVTIDFARSRPTLQVQIANSVLSQINAQRKAHGLPALSMSSRLVAAAHAHNHKMAAYNTMSHQLPGELGLGPRVLAAGYDYRTAGENVGWNSLMTQSGAQYLQTLMYNELPPNDGHRQNILNPTYRHVGVDILFDTLHHKLWLTTDFGSLL